MPSSTHNRITAGAVHRVGVQSNDRLRREALAAYLETLPIFKVAGHVASYPDASSLCTLEQPDIMVLDGGPEPADENHDVGLLQRA